MAKPPEDRAKLDVTATRHPAVASKLLVSVQDQNGLVDGLEIENFAAFVWASQIPLPGYSRFDLPVLDVTQLRDGFYGLKLGLSSVHIGSDGGDFEMLGADELGALVLGVVVQRADDRGHAIAVTPLRGEAP
jgi:hypothetical protein